MFKEHRYSPNENIFLQGEYTPAIYYIEKGEVTIYQDNDWMPPFKKDSEEDESSSSEEEEDKVDENGEEKAEAKEDKKE